MNESGALLRDVRRPSGDPVEVVNLAVTVRYGIVPVFGAEPLARYRGFAGAAIVLSGFLRKPQTA